MHCGSCWPCTPACPTLLPLPPRTGEPLPKLEVDAVRGLQGVKEATLVLPTNPTTLVRARGRDR